MRKEAFLAGLAGFTLSFVTILILAVMPAGAPFLGQLLTGDTTRGPGYPTTFNIVYHNEILMQASRALASFWFWSAVIISGSFITFGILRMLRR